MPDLITDFYKATSIIDIVYLVITIFSLIKCYKKGFVLSILSMAKWLFAYVITLLIFPRIKPYLKNIIDNEYVLDIGLGIAILNTSITIVFGFSILVFSNFIPTIYFGIFTGIAMLLAMISVLTLLPALLIKFKPFETS